MTTGCSFGGYHAINFALRHPDIVTGAVSMGGAFDIHQFLDGYYDDNCYYNCPPDFLPNLTDPGIWIATTARSWCWLPGKQISAWTKICASAGIMHGQTIPHWLDVWGDGAAHDWPWWQQMAVKFF